MTDPPTIDARKQTALRDWWSATKRVEELMAQDDPDAALAAAETAARLAEEIGDPARLRSAGRALQALNRSGASARLLALAERIEQPGGLPEWDGSSVGTLLIVERNQHVGRAIRTARLIALAAERARRCIVLAEPRLVPLFRRSFPGVDVRPAGADDAAADAVAGYNTLVHRLAYDDATLSASFAPLTPDPALVAGLKQRYGAFPRPLIGISWRSVSPHKQTPSLTDWANFLRSQDASYVSLQYGDTSSDVNALRAATGRVVVDDPAVDSLVDLDLYAGQVAAADAIVTISSTCAHMAGALGIRTFTVLDDKLRLTWPLGRETTPWYPGMTLVRQEKRNWQDVFAEIAGRLSSFLETRRSATGRSS